MPSLPQHAPGMFPPPTLPRCSSDAPLRLYAPRMLPKPACPLPASAMMPSLQCPPVSVAMFGLSQVARIASHVLDTVLRHTKLYAYVLTPQVSLALSDVGVQWGTRPALIPLTVF